MPNAIPDVAIIGGGMITRDQLLPSVFHLQRLGRVGQIAVCASRLQTVDALANSPVLREAFPGQSFRAFPQGDAVQPEAYAELIGQLLPGQIVIVAVPDQLHFEVVMAALRHDQHVCCVKPLALRHSDTLAIRDEAFARGLVVAVEYHKRFDDRSLMARRRYRAGLFGEFQLGSARLMEKWYYRHSNFQNWCTAEHSDAFSYIGCHYVDLVHFITGLLPVEVGVYGIPDRYPNGKTGYLWTDARVIWDNGACLNVQNSLSFPDEAPGTNTQGLTLYCRGAENGALLTHSDQYRGLEYVYTRNPGGEGATLYAEPSPDYFQYVDLGGGGLTPVGYGYRSIEHIVAACTRVAFEPDLARRQQLLVDLDEQGILATPANSDYNERVVEAARRSIQNGGTSIRLTV